MAYKNPKVLGVVIPAYKTKYLSQVFECLAQETLDRVSVYVCDDGGPSDISEIVDQYRDKIPINYHRFSNIGSKDVTAHWNRSVDLVEEEWVWLFSDDDLIERGTVQHVVETIVSQEECDLIRLQSVIINEHNRIIAINPPHPEFEDVAQYAYFRLKGQRASFAPDHIFRKNVYASQGGFVSFPSAWCSDDATWIKFGEKKGIRTVNQGKLMWRQSSINISRPSRLKFNDQRLSAVVQYIVWLDNFIAQHRPEWAPRLKVLYPGYYARQMLNTRSLCGPKSFNLVRHLANQPRSNWKYLCCGLAVALRTTIMSY